MPSPSPSASNLRRRSLCVGEGRPGRGSSWPPLLTTVVRTIRSRASVAWPVSLAPRGTARGGNTGSAPGVAPFAGLIPVADGSGVCRPVPFRRAVHPIGPTCRWRARRPGRFHRGTVGRVRWMLEGGGRPAFPWPDDGRGRVSLGSWALPPRPVRAAGRFAVPRRAADPALGVGPLSGLGTPGAAAPFITERSQHQTVRPHGLRVRAGHQPPGPLPAPIRPWAS
jgi:hypothetical protein